VKDSHQVNDQLTTC